MTERRCEYCKFWRYYATQNPTIVAGNCLSEDVATSCGRHIQTPGEHRYVSLGTADKIIAIFEKHKA